MQQYMYAQRKKIEIDKWYEGIKRNCDPGNEFVLWWIQTYGDRFRTNWDLSLCRNCRSSIECGYNVRENCEDFILG